MQERHWRAEGLSLYQVLIQARTCKEGTCIELPLKIELPRLKSKLKPVNVDPTPSADPAEPSLLPTKTGPRKAKVASRTEAKLPVLSVMFGHKSKHQRDDLLLGWPTNRSFLSN